MYYMGNENAIDERSDFSKSMGREMSDAENEKDGSKVKSVMSKIHNKINEENGISKAALYAILSRGYQVLIDIGESRKEKGTSKIWKYLMSSKNIIDREEQLTDFGLAFKSRTNILIGNYFYVNKRLIEAIRQYIYAQNDIFNPFAEYFYCISLIDYCAMLDDIYENEQIYLFHEVLHRIDNLIHLDRKYPDDTVFESAEKLYKDILLSQSEEIDRLYTERFASMKTSHIEEAQYCEWCKQYKLFLNPVNFILPNIDYFNDDNIMFHLEQEEENIQTILYGIKTDYLFARREYYSLCTDKNSISFDKDINFHVDNYIYSERVKRLVSCYNVLYDIYGKISNLIMRLYSVDLRQDDINLYKVTKAIKDSNVDVFNNNNGLIGLYWIGKELYADSSTNSSLNLLSKCRILRNNFVHDNVSFVCTQTTEENDNDTVQITIDEFNELIIYLFGRVREALLYLMICINSKNK